MRRRMSLTMAGLVPVCVGALMAILVLQAQGPADEIRGMEQARLKAQQTGRGLSELLASDYFRVIPPGQVATDPPSSQPNTAAYAKDVTVILATASSGIVTTLQGPRPATAQVPSKTDPDRVLRVWAKQGGAWKIVAQQGVWVRPQPQTPPAPRNDVKNVPYKPANSTEAAVVSVNQALNEAFRARDGAAYEANTAPEFIRISSYGAVTPRSDFVKNAVLGGTAARVAQAWDEVRVRVYGDVAVISYRNLRGNERMMRVFVNRGGAWKAAAAISTIIWPAAAG